MNNPLKPRTVKGNTVVVTSMMRSLLRLYVVSIFMSFRRHVKIDRKDSRIYEQTFRVSAEHKEYKIRVSETYFIIQYHRWLPKIKRRFYKAELFYLINGLVEHNFIEHYPDVTFGPTCDPLYPLGVIAQVHWDAYLLKENIT